MTWTIRDKIPTLTYNYATYSAASEPSISSLTFSCPWPRFTQSLDPVTYCTFAPISNDGLNRTNELITGTKVNKIIYDKNIVVGVKALDRYEEIASKYESQDPDTYLPDGTYPTIVAGYKQKQRVYTAAMRSRGVSFLEYMMSGSPTYSPQNVHPVSRGTVAGNTTDPEAEVVVDYRAATNLVDVGLVVGQIKFFRRFMTTGVLAQYNATESVPGAEVQTGRAARRVGTGYYRAERVLPRWQGG